MGQSYYCDHILNETMWKTRKQVVKQDWAHKRMLENVHLVKGSVHVNVNIEYIKQICSCHKTEGL